MVTGSVPHPLPGAVGLSHLSPYGGEAADGVRGGSPPLHLVCTEADVVTDGRGAVRAPGRAGAPAAAERTGTQLDALEAGDDPDHLVETAAHVAAPTRRGGFGMCGRRDAYALPGTALPDMPAGS
ncbi:hypothetical protein ACFW6K_22685 [Streptomyces sp. NPDC058733]|uniref:hypothetical protein n=1 Tax=Streptomyces sp. NPDC058733 TaxID=3346614 RepID=UPI0036CECAF2